MRSSVQLAPLTFATRRDSTASRLLSCAIKFSHASSTCVKNLIASLDQISHELHRRALAQRGEQAFFRSRIPKPLQRITHLPAGNTQADVPRRDVFHRVRLVENHEIILEKDAAFDFFLDAAEVHEKQACDSTPARPQERIRLRARWKKQTLLRSFAKSD